MANGVDENIPFVLDCVVDFKDSMLVTHTKKESAGLSLSVLETESARMVKANAMWL